MSNPSSPSSRLPLTVRLAAMGLLVIFGILLGMWFMRPQITEREVQQILIATIQRETAASFFVTGTLDIVATTSVTETKYLFPDYLRIDLGTTASTARLPGRVHYGFDAQQLRPEDIRLGVDGVIDLSLPPLRVYAVEPNLEAMEVETTVGWARMYASSGRRIEQQAIRHGQEILRTQGEQHLDDSTQPQLNTAEALKTLLTPILQAAGMAEPRFRVQIGTNLVLEPEG